MEKNIFASVGDPAGIGSEIIFKALVSATVRRAVKLEGVRITLAAPASFLSTQARLFGFELRPMAGRDGEFDLIDGSAPDLEPVGISIVGLGSPRQLDALALLGIIPTEEILADCRSLLAGQKPVPFGEIHASCALLACLSLEAAHNLALERQGALVTAPINKESFKALGVPFPGHTEFLGALAGGLKGLTMFETKGLRIFFHSRHVSLRKACDLVTTDRVLQSIRECLAALEDMGLPEAHLAVAGLNPHNGEHGLFGTEEEDWIRPAVIRAQSEGLKVSGPIPADSVFHQAKNGRFDAVLSLYHDQGHIAAKTLDFDRTVSLTLGLDVLRSSVDHGTAFDIAGKNEACAIGMEEALRAGWSYLRT